MNTFYNKKYANKEQNINTIKYKNKVDEVITQYLFNVKRLFLEEQRT